MRIGNVSFTANSWEAFTKLTRKEQIETLKNTDPRFTDKELDNLLKTVSYGKPKKSKPKAKKSNTKQTSDRSGNAGGEIKGTESGKD